MRFPVSPCSAGFDRVCSLAGAHCTLPPPPFTLLSSPLLCQQVSLSFSFLLLFSLLTSFLARQNVPTALKIPPFLPQAPSLPFSLPLFLSLSSPSSLSSSLSFTSFLSCLHFSSLSACLSTLFAFSSYIPAPSSFSVSLRSLARTGIT